MHNLINLFLMTYLKFKKSKIIRFEGNYIIFTRLFYILLNATNIKS